MNVFISGGCKNGKSMFAQKVAAGLGGPLYYVATMIPYDEEDHERIKRHLRERDGWGFKTIECGTEILNALDGLERGSDGKVKGTFLMDSVTALLLNEMFGSDFSKTGDPQAGERCASELHDFALSVQNAVFVSDFLYSDSAEYDEFTEVYRKGLSVVDRELAALCDSVVEICAGNKVYYKGCEWDEDGKMR